MKAWAAILWIPANARRAHGRAWRDDGDRSATDTRTNEGAIRGEKDRAVAAQFECLFSDLVWLDVLSGDLWLRDELACVSPGTIAARPPRSKRDGLHTFSVGKLRLHYQTNNEPLGRIRNRICELLFLRGCPPSHSALRPKPPRQPITQIGISQPTLDDRDGDDL